MKVMCVKHLGKKCGITGMPMPSPEIGDEDVVINEEITQGYTYYSLERFGMGHSYRSDHFATLPDASADEMQEAEREAIVNLEKEIA